ncbi:non-classical export protein 1 domain-containing protein [Hirsutella rhossiliensis]|uniref:Non-classical export protein 1 domain-containing protein n=1 Tax=Hirsutella rhossiliensis TaxID=111463 RepID=A0A9P8MTG3_9HYPO|nr:non-classical export protein 1 domain-containing protein [Hirsutella rhossiliensis]KAH0960864.1 non-classical export protein 1 domain-containing protein [Hirsutella rhossiliensis]
MPAPTYIISRVADPIFAVFIGVSAAVTRINREQKSKGKTANETIEAGLRYGGQTFLTLGLTCWNFAQNGLIKLMLHDNAHLDAKYSIFDPPSSLERELCASRHAVDSWT